jgi:hypothetical protein
MVTRFSVWLTQRPGPLLIPFEQILAVDEIGDAYNEPPHLLVVYREGNQPSKNQSEI